MKEKSKNEIPASDDWRKQGQENYLKGVKLALKDYYPYRSEWDHDHCEFCGSQFSLKEGDIGVSCQLQYFSGGVKSEQHPGWV